MPRTRRLAAAALVGMTFAAAPAARAADPVVMAAGDISCATDDPFFFAGHGDATHCAQRRTAALLDSATAVLALGDNQYNAGSFSQYQAAFNPSWGRFK